MVYWDATLSRANSDLKKEFDLLTKVISRFSFDRVVVTAFRNVPDKPKEFEAVHKLLLDLREATDRMGRLERQNLELRRELAEARLRPSRPEAKQEQQVAV